MLYTEFTHTPDLKVGTTNSLWVHQMYITRDKAILHVP